MTVRNPLHRILNVRDVAQLGSASVLGTEGRRFKSCHPDKLGLISQSTNHGAKLKTNVEKLNPTRVKLTIEVDQASFKPTLDKAYKTVSEQVNIPGFRRARFQLLC